MGSGASTSTTVAEAGVLPVGTEGVAINKRRITDTTTTSDAHDWRHTGFGSIKKRTGHPMQFKSDGYRILRRHPNGKPPIMDLLIAESPSSGDTFLLKEYSLHSLPKGDDHVQKEVRIGHRLSHNMLPKLVEVFVTEGSVFVVEEFIDSKRLTDLIHLDDTEEELHVLSPYAVQNLGKSLVCALQYLHEEGVVLRDVTPDNIRVDALSATKFDVQIADLASATEEGGRDTITSHPLYACYQATGSKSSSDDIDNDVDSEDMSEAERMKNVLYYQAPELTRTHGGAVSASPAQDMWALGVLCYLLLCGCLPFELDNLAVLGSDTAAGLGAKNLLAGLFQEPAWQGISARCKSFVSALLTLDPEDRLTSAKALRHPFLLIGP